MSSYKGFVCNSVRDQNTLNLYIYYRSSMDRYPHKKYKIQKIQKNIKVCPYLWSPKNHLLSTE